MKKMILSMALALTFGIGAMAQNDNGRHGHGQHEAPTVEQRTEGMAKRLDLSDEQKAKLLDLNKQYEDVMNVPMGMQRQGQGNRRHAEADSTKQHRQRHEKANGEKAHKGNASQEKAGNGNKRRPEPTAEQKAEWEAKHQQMEAKRKEYDAKLKEILTEEQYQKLHEGQGKGHGKQDGQGRAGRRGR